MIHRTTGCSERLIDCQGLSGSAYAAQMSALCRVNSRWLRARNLNLRLSRLRCNSPIVLSTLSHTAHPSISRASARLSAFMTAKKKPAEAGRVPSADRRLQRSSAAESRNQMTTDAVLCYRRGNRRGYSGSVGYTACQPTFTERARCSGKHY